MFPTMVPKTLAESAIFALTAGWKMDRDINACLNIRAPDLGGMERSEHRLCEAGSPALLGAKGERHSVEILTATTVLVSAATMVAAVVVVIAGVGICACSTS